jgi:hypothetical protein
MTMQTSIVFFPVGNGDMTLISLCDDADTKILVDCNIRAAADDEEDDTPDVASDLRARLKRDDKGRPYVDVFLISHPDQDHCRGIQNHFYLGPPSKYPDDKRPDTEKRILIRELWSSPIVFRRTSKEHTLCEDAQALNKEAKRRVAVNLESNFSGISDGDRILILGEDEDGKTDDLTPIVVELDDTIDKVNGVKQSVFKAKLLAPLPLADEDEEQIRKNHSSVILNIELAEDSSLLSSKKKFLIGGDAEVLIWEKLWKRHRWWPSALSYDILLTPHHCSWHSLSNDSRSELGADAEVSSDAKSALSQIRDEGFIIASSCAIKDDDCDPPCYAAKEQYESIAKKAKGKFLCTGEYPSEASPSPIEFVISEGALKQGVRKAVVASPRTLNKGLIDEIGSRGAYQEPVRKGGNSRYA